VDLRSCQRNAGNTATRDTIQALGAKAEIVACDLADKAAVKSLTRHIVGPVSEGGLERTIDILINCGGIIRRCVLDLDCQTEVYRGANLSLTPIVTLHQERQPRITLMRIGKK
jgi:NAD(P)-dependent dehydrogenase (short-subunit alcohol dehydrogenase family)